jgi:lipopolysaccharide biosynthesis glycosyltransferase
MKFLSSKRIQNLKDHQIYFGVDDNYVWPLLVTIYSAKKSYQSLRSVNLVYDSSQLSTQNRDLVVKAVKSIGLTIILKEVKLLEVVDFHSHLSKSAILRLSIPDQTKKLILWLDSDLLLLEGWNEILAFGEKINDSNFILAARKHWDFERSANNLSLIKSGQFYFNSGVMLINCKLWKKLKISIEVSYLISRYSDFHFEWADQCVLNYLIGNEYSEISKEFNAPTNEYLVNETRILHFAGSNKPWSHRINDSGQLVSKDDIAVLEFADESDFDAFTLYRSIEAEAINRYDLARPMQD